MNINISFVFDLIGYISIIFSLIAFNSLNKQNARINGLISTSLFTIHLYHYNDFNGMFVSIISIISKLLSIFINENKLTILKYISPIISFIFFYYINDEGLIGILPSISLIFIIIADIQKDIIKMKFIYFGSAFSWLIYAICINSIPAILYDVFGIIVLIYSILKLKKNN